MTIILDEWSASPDFIRLQSYATSGNVSMKGTFDDQSGLYRHVWRQRARALTQYFADLVSHKLKPYGLVKWFAFEARKASEISTQFIPFLNEIERLITWMKKEISPASVMTFFHLTNHEIWNALDEIVVSQTNFKLVLNFCDSSIIYANFSHFGASQMFFDITTGLIPLLEDLYKWPKVAVSDGTLNKVSYKNPEAN